MKDGYMDFFYGIAIALTRDNRIAIDNRYVEEAVRTIINENLSQLSYSEPLQTLQVVAEKSYAQISFMPVDGRKTLYLKNLSVDSYRFALLWLEMSHYNSRARLKLNYLQ